MKDGDIKQPNTYDSVMRHLNDLYADGRMPRKKLENIKMFMEKGGVLQKGFLKYDTDRYNEITSTMSRDEINHELMAIHGEQAANIVRDRLRAKLKAKKAKTP